MMRICATCRREIGANDHAHGPVLPKREDEVATYGICMEDFARFCALDAYERHSKDSDKKDGA